MHSVLQISVSRNLWKQRKKNHILQIPYLYLWEIMVSPVMQVICSHGPGQTKGLTACMYHCFFMRPHCSGQNEFMNLFHKLICCLQPLVWQTSVTIIRHWAGTCSIPTVSPAEHFHFCMIPIWGISIC